MAQNPEVTRFQVVARLVNVARVVIVARVAQGMMIVRVSCLHQTTSQVRRGRWKNVTRYAGFDFTSASESSNFTLLGNLEQIDRF